MSKKKIKRVRAIPCKITAVEGCDEWQDLFWELVRGVQRINNDICFLWLVWHAAKENIGRLRKWRAEYVAAKQKDPKAKVKKCPVDPWPAAFNRQLEAQLKEMWDTHAKQAFLPCGV